MSRGPNGGGAQQPPQDQSTPPGTAPATEAQAPAAAQPSMSMGDLASIIANAVSQGVAAALSAVGLKQQPDDEPPPPDPREAQTEIEAQLQERRYLIIISKGEKMCVDPVPVGVNGITRTIKRGEYAIATQSMLEVLENSQEEHIDPETREPYHVQSYPVSVLREIPQEDWGLTAAEVREKYAPDRNRMN